MNSKSVKLKMLLELLQKNSSGMTLNQLADRLGVHYRTVKRYISEARQEGFRIDDLRNASNKESKFTLGEIHKVPKHFIPSLKKITTEMNSWGNPKFINSLNQVTEYLEILNKNGFEKSFSQNQNYKTKKNVYHIDHGPFSQEGVSDNLLKILEQAIINHFQIKVLYKIPKSGKREFIFFPYYLSLRVGKLYLIGRESSNQGLYKSLLIKRILRCNTSGKTFKPSLFDIESYYKYCFGQFPRQENEKPTKVILELRELWIEQHLKESHFNPMGKVYEKEGKKIFEVMMVIKPDFTNWVFSLMPDLIPMAPKSLVKELNNRLDRIRGVF